MKLTLAEAAHRLEATAGSIRQLVLAAPREAVEWHPAPGAWSILEVVNHLADEEVEDFRTRLDFALHRPGEAPPPIDPEGWVTARRYAERELRPSLDRFLDERARSLDWLRGLGAPDLSRPFRDGLSAGGLLGCWAAHDLLHVRQLARLHHRYLERLVEPESLEYAGVW